jgi:1-acyl-sn-glycerol-3-phosphate acyltransferase
VSARPVPKLPTHPRDPLPMFMQLLVGHLLLRPTAMFFYRARLLRACELPDGPCVFACNHRSFYDPPLVGMWQPRPISYFARASLWKNPFVAFFLRIMYGIPVDRDNPGLTSMKGAIERLKRGVPVLVFPEGTRTRTGRLAPFRDGPALFARRAGVPIVPVYVYRSDQAMPRDAILPRLSAKGIEVRIGTPIVAPPDLDPRDQDVWVSRRLWAWMVLQERRLLGHRRGGAG